MFIVVKINVIDLCDVVSCLCVIDLMNTDLVGDELVYVL
jgi:hypothetical protein